MKYKEEKWYKDSSLWAGLGLVIMIIWIWIKG